MKVMKILFHEFSVITDSMEDIVKTLSCSSSTLLV